VCRLLTIADLWDGTLAVSNEEDRQMGLFGMGKNKSAYEFGRKLKEDPQLMLNVLKLFEGNPTIESIKRGVRHLGFDLEPSEMLDAIKAAVEFYQDVLGTTPGSGGSGGGFMGFKQD